MGLSHDIYQTFDLFKYKVGLRTRLSPSYRPGHHMFYGSDVGFLLSIMVLLMMASYGSYLSFEMLSYNKDVYNS